MSRFLRRTSLAACSVLFAMLAASATAQPRPLPEGQAYAVLETPIATESGTDRIEILDVFWYGCPVCAEFEPMASYWGGEIRGDLVMRRMPAVWNEVMRLHARLYFTAQALDREQQVHREAFRRIHEEQQPLNEVTAIRALFDDLGVAPDAFLAAWDSAEVNAAVQRAEADTRAAGIERLPAMIVNGRYRVVRNQHVPDLPDIFIAVNELIKGERGLRRSD